MEQLISLNSTSNGIRAPALPERKSLLITTLGGNAIEIDKSIYQCLIKPHTLGDIFQATFKRDKRLEANTITQYASSPILENVSELDLTRLRQKEIMRICIYNSSWKARDLQVRKHIHPAQAEPNHSCLQLLLRLSHVCAPSPSWQQRRKTHALSTSAPITPTMRAESRYQKLRDSATLQWSSQHKGEHEYPHPGG